MRMLVLPAAFLLSFPLYILLPQAHGALLRALESLYRRFSLRAAHHAPSFFILLPGLAAALLCAVHPVAAVLVTTPLFTAASALPGCVALKEELDSGKFARNIPAYEEHVRKACLSLAPAFIGGAVAPMLLCAAGMPLYIGSGFGWVYMTLHVLHPHCAWMSRALVLVLRLSEKIFCFLLRLCSGAVGRNPLRAKGSDARTLLLSTLGVAEDETKTHPPMAGDIAQGIFLCIFCCAVLLLLLTLVGFAFC